LLQKTVVIVFLAVIALLSMISLCVMVVVVPTLLLPKDGGVEELHGNPTVGPRPKVWTKGQKWKK